MHGTNYQVIQVWGQRLVAVKFASKHDQIQLQRISQQLGSFSKFSVCKRSSPESRQAMSPHLDQKKSSDP
jgi:hypothetical protein